MPKKETASTFSKEELEKASQALAAAEAREREEEAKEKAAKAQKKAEKLAEAEAAAKAKKGGKSKKRGSKYTDSKSKINKDKAYTITEAVNSLKKIKFAKFNESVELHLKLGIDPKNTDQRVRFTASLPYGTGKSVKILVISDQKVEDTNVVVYRPASQIDDIVNGKLVPGKDFDIVVTTPAHMKDIAKAAKILGPKGIMPNPKTGTVTNDIEKTIANLAKGQVEIKNQAGHAVLHAIVGNVNFKDEELVENISFILTELSKNQPSKLKKKFIQRAFVATTMSPSLRLAI